MYNLLAWVLVKGFHENAITMIFQVLILASVTATYHLLFEVL